MPIASMPAPSAPRRQARVLEHAVILPAGIEPHRWYDVVEGRRRDDARPGMVLLSLGARMLHLPERCLQFRSLRSAVAPRKAAPLAAGLQARALRAAVQWSRRVTPRQVALAASILPVGLAVIGVARRAIAER